MSTFSEFSKNANHGDMNKSSDRSSDIAKNRIDPKTGNEREDREDAVDRDRSSRSLQENSNPRASQNRNRERSPDRNER